MSSTVIAPIGAALGELAGDIDGMKSFTWAPLHDLDELPAAVVYLPAIQRVAPDDPEDHLGQNDWTLDYPVHFHFDATDRSFTQPQIADAIEAFVKAVDAGVPFGLDGMVEDAKVISVAEPVSTASPNDREMWRVDTRVEVFAFVTAT